MSARCSPNGSPPRARAPPMRLITSGHCPNCAIAAHVLTSHRSGKTKRFSNCPPRRHPRDSTCFNRFPVASRASPCSSSAHDSCFGFPPCFGCRCSHGCCGFWALAPRKVVAGRVVRGAGAPGSRTAEKWRPNTGAGRRKNVGGARFLCRQSES